MTRRAFTLIELLLALVIAVMLSMSLYASLRSALKARDSATSATEPMRAASIVAGLVRQDLESVPPPTGVLAGPFIGVADAVQFCTIGSDDANDDSPLAEGVRRIELLVRDDVNPPTLVRRVTRNLMPSMTAEYQEEVLSRNVRSFKLHYFDGSSWQETWDSTTLGDVLPMAVAVIVEIADPAHPEAQPRRSTCVVPLPCGKLSDVSTLGGL